MEALAGVVELAWPERGHSPGFDDGDGGGEDRGGKEVTAVTTVVDGPSIADLGNHGPSSRGAGISCNYFPC